MERNYNEATSAAALSSRSEMDRYINEYQIPYDKHYNPLNYWKQNQSKNPVLSAMARDYLSIQPTSVASERTFSQGGLTVTKCRNRLTPETVKKMMCLKSWLK